MFFLDWYLFDEVMLCLLILLVRLRSLGLFLFDLSLKNVLLFWLLFLFWRVEGKVFLIFWLFENLIFDGEVILVMVVFLLIDWIFFLIWKFFLFFILVFFFCILFWFVLFLDFFLFIEFLDNLFYVFKFMFMLFLDDVLFKFNGKKECFMIRLLGVGVWDIFFCVW